MLLDISRRYCLSSDKSHYENVPFELPEGWVWTTLGEISNYGESTNVPVDKISRESWVLELEDIEKDSGRLIQRRVKADRKINGVRHSFSNGCILYSKLRTYLNKVLIADQSGYCTTEIIPITCNKGVMPEYLCQVLRSNYFVDYTISLGYGVKMPRLGTADAIKSMIPLPPIHEQARIVALINRLATYIELLEANKQDAIEVANKIKSKILDFAVQGKLISQDPLDEPAIELLKRLIPQYKTADNRHYENKPFSIPDSWVWVMGKDLFLPMKNCKPSGEYFKYIDIDSIDNQDCVIKCTKVLPVTAAPSRATRYTQVGDILFSMVRPYLKNIAIVTEGNCIASTGFYVCSPNEALFSKYCYYLMISPYVINGLTQFMKGDNSPSINNARISEWLYPLPPLNEQKRIVQKIDEIFNYLDSIVAEL